MGRQESRCKTQGPGFLNLDFRWIQEPGSKNQVLRLKNQDF